MTPVDSTDPRPAREEGRPGPMRDLAAQGEWAA